jgi:hypothetical protein
MRIPTATEFEKAQRALEAYAAFSAQYVQKNGWTVIPADAPRPAFEGEELSTDAVNAYSTTVELYRLATDKPDRFSAYMVDRKDKAPSLTTWTGETIGAVKETGPWNRNNFGARWRSVRVRADWGGVYYGREYDNRQLVNFRRAKNG